MTNTYTINSTTVPNGGTVTLNTGAGLNGTYLTTGTSATTYTTGTSTSYQWANPNNEVMRINQTNPPELEVKGRMILNGVDLEERLDTIEKVLQIPERDVTLEKKHPKLKKLYDDYIKALAKYRTWEAIKGNDDN
jgi:hypothetical protein